MVEGVLDQLAEGAQAHDDTLSNASWSKDERHSATIGLSRCTLAPEEPSLRKAPTSTGHTKEKREKERERDYENKIYICVRLELKDTDISHLRTCIPGDHRDSSALGTTRATLRP